MSFQVEVKKLRSKKGLSMRGLAAKCGVSYQTIFNIEHGVCGTTSRVRRAIKLALRVRSKKA